MQYLEDCSDLKKKPANNQKVKKSKQQKTVAGKGKLQVVIPVEAPSVVSKPVEGFKMKFKTEICKFWQLNGTCEY